MDVSASCVPITLFSKLSKGNRETMNTDHILESLYGNPNGLGISSVPYIYCVSPQQVKSNLEKLYYLELTFRWPPTTRFIDETHSQSPTNPTYEEYLGLDYIGVERMFSDTRRYVIFNPVDYLVRIVDVDTKQVLYKNERLCDNVKGSVPGDDWIKVSNFLFESGMSKEQERVNSLMIEHIGAQFIDIKRDFFNVFEIARRKGVSRRAVQKYLTPLIDRIKVNKVSGCWTSNHKGDYKRTFWLSKGGMNFSDIFHFPQTIGCHNTNVVIKNRDILHSTICETTLGAEHIKCCRPYHLKLGTSRENAVHIKIRKSLDQLFDFDYKEMQEYCFHILRLSNLIERQVHTVTEDELKVQRRRSNRILYCEEVGSSRKWVDVCGEPDMGDANDEPNVGEMNGDEEEEEEEDMKMWKLLEGDNYEGDQEDVYRSQYITLLQNTDTKEEDEII
jgi:hypothetical protein